jgi:N,N'-diacetyl-8-epilegionaminate cytidylyltransferase
LHSAKAAFNSQPMETRTTAFIFARGGSKGVARKNIRPLAGKPLIAYAIEVAMASRYVAQVVVSTDSEAIAEVARAYGALVPFMRPVALAQDDSPEWLAWRHAIAETQKMLGEEAVPFFLSVPATCPLRVPEDIDACVEALFADAKADIAITTTPAHANPYFTMVRAKEDGYLTIAAKPETPIARRQEAPRINEIVGIAYAARPEFVMTKMGIWEGRVRGITVPQERAVDIDTEHDFKVADFLMCERLKEGQ